MFHNTNEFPVAEPSSGIVQGLKEQVDELRNKILLFWLDCYLDCVHELNLNLAIFKTIKFYDLLVVFFYLDKNHKTHYRSLRTLKLYIFMLFKALLKIYKFIRSNISYKVVERILSLFL